MESAYRAQRSVSVQRTNDPSVKSRDSLLFVMWLDVAHTMLAVYHLATRQCALSSLAGIPSLIEQAGIMDVPQATQRTNP